MSLIDGTDATFEQDVLKSEGVVLVDFWAPWCGPCKMVAPTLDALAADRGDNLKIVKLNIDDNPHTPTEFGVRSIPTLALFKEGKLLDTKVGVQSKAQLAEWIDSQP